MSSDTYPQRNLSLGGHISKKIADKIMRNNIHNVEVLKNRLKVLSSQADYNRFRSKYQTQKIQRHNTIHQISVNQKHEIIEQLKMRVNLEQKKQKAQRIKSQLKDKLNEVFERLKQSKEENRNDIKQIKQKNKEILSIRKSKDIQKRRKMKEEVSLMELGVKQALQRYKNEKKEEVRANQEYQKKNLLNYSLEMAKQLEILSQKQKELININSQSMQNSRFVNLQFKKLYENKPNNLHLPVIKRKSPTHSTSTHFQ